MRKPRFTSGLLLRGAVMACLAGQACSANAESILIDDFNDGNDEGWLRVDDFAGVAGPGIFDASTGQYNLKTTGLAPGFAIISSYWDLSSDPLYSNGYLRAKVKANTQGTTVGLGLRADTSFENGYYFVASTDNDDFLLWRQYNGEFVSLDYIDVPFAPGEEWMIEAGAVGDLLSMKVWRVCEEEPADPQLKFHDATLTAGRFLVEAHNGSGSTIRADGVFDDIYFTPVPEPSNLLLCIIALGVVGGWWK